MTVSALATPLYYSASAQSASIILGAEYELKPSFIGIRTTQINLLTHADAGNWQRVAHIFLMLMAARIKWAAA